MATIVEKGHIIKTDGILTGNDLASGKGVQTYRAWIKKVRRESTLAKVIMDGKKLEEEPAGQAVEARIEYGRWIASCPDCGEVAVENIEPSDPVFFCFSCCNAGNNYHFRPVAIPADRDELEKELLKRYHADIFWLPGETVNDVKEQNKELKKQGKLKE